ncbi:MAG: signal transduction histidine kinase [Oleispira sp.]|jgi:signal transduction histidine kinase
MNNIFKRYFSSVENSISRRLLRSVLSIYIVLTLIVTAAQVAIQYYSAKSAVQDMLVASEETFKNILTADLWSYDYDELSITAESMMQMPFITGIKVTIPEESQTLFNSTKETELENQHSFWHEFELTFLQDEELFHIGNVRVYSDISVVINHIESGLYILIINAIIKTIALIILITVVFNKLLTRPLEKLAHHAESIDIENLEYKPIKVTDNPKDELGMLQIAMNSMMGKTLDTIKKLDTFNKNLEKSVMARTYKLRETVGELDKEQCALKTEVESRKESELALSKSLEQLKQAQVKLVSSEKMASLGMLAAGIAHEINNPISFVLNNVNVLSEYNEAFHTLIKDYKSYSEALLLVDGKAQDILSGIQQYEKEEDIDFIISDSLSLLKSTEDGILRIIDIVKNMKTFSHPDTESVISVDVHEVLDSTLLLLKNETRNNLRIIKELNASDFMIRCNRNQLGQVFLNIIINAAQATAKSSDSTIHIRTENIDQAILIHIVDNGCGISADTIELIYDPFYTTKEVGEGTGMGLSISYGIVNKYKGKINVTSVLGEGTEFTLQFPLE